MPQRTAERQTAPGSVGGGSGARRSPQRLLTLGAIAVIAVVALGAIYLATGRGGGSGGVIAVLRTQDFHALAISPTDPNVIFFGHHNGVMRSDDGGRSWRDLVARPNFDAMNLAIHPTDARQMFLAGHEVLQVSADGGSTWQPVNSNLPGIDVHGYAMSPDDPNRLYAYVMAHGLFKSNDAGRTWTKATDGLPGDVMSLAVAGGESETLYAGSMGTGVLRSTDGGQTWTRTSNGLVSPVVYTLAVDPVNRQTVYAGIDGGIYKSTDAGSTWSRLPFPGSNAVVLAVSPTQPDVLLAIMVRVVSRDERQGLVYRSEDGGLTWDGSQ